MSSEYGSERATRRPIGDEEKQGTEHVDDRFDALDERHPAGDREAAQEKRAGDADEDDAAA